MREEARMPRWAPPSQWAVAAMNPDAALDVPLNAWRDVTAMGVGCVSTKSRVKNAGRKMRRPRHCIDRGRGFLGFLSVKCRWNGWWLWTRFVFAAE